MAGTYLRWWGGKRCCQWAKCRHAYPTLFFLVVSLTQAHDEESTGGKHAPETTTALFREFPRRPSLEPDYSGVVKLALGAAIVMLAGVILALVWNLYREKRRMARGASHSSRRNQSRNARNGRRRAVSIPPQDLPPSYNDIFIISSSEPRRRHEKPPSYDEAMRDHRLLPGPAYVNFGFTNDASSPQSGISLPPARMNACIIDMQNPGLRSAVISVPSSFNAASASDGSLSSLNIASIIRRLHPTFAEPTNTGERCVTSYSSLESPCRRALRGLSEPSVRKEMPDPIVTVRRTKSGRAGSSSSDFNTSCDEDIDKASNSDMVAAACSTNSTPQNIQTVKDKLSREGCVENSQIISSSSQSAQEENINLAIFDCSSENCNVTHLHQSALSNVNQSISDITLPKQCTSLNAQSDCCGENVTEHQRDDDQGTIINQIINHETNTQEVTLGVLRATTAASDC